MKAPPRSAAKPSAELPLFHAWLLAICMAEFCHGWIYGLGLPEWTDRLPLRLATWALIPIAVGIHIHRHGVSRSLSGVLPFLPFWLIGVVASATGRSPLSSVTLQFMWLAMALAAAIIGTRLEVDRILDIVVAVLFTLVLGSAVVSLALPDAGTMFAAGKMVWRGMFTHKNELGQISGLALLLGIYVGRERHSRLAWLTAALAALCLVMSDSKGGLSSAAAALMMSWLIKAMGRKLSPALTFVLLLALIAQAAILFIYGLPLLLQALDRDPTLTGRTVIWDLYVQAASQSPWLGAGPGTYTNHVVPNELTYPLVIKLLQYGLILTPHNLFIGVFGDTGLFGLSALVATLLWLAIATPLYRLNTAGRLSSAVALLIIFNGLIETGLPFGPSATSFVLVLFFAAALRASSAPEEEQAATTKHRTGPTARPA